MTESDTTCIGSVSYTPHEFLPSLKYRRICSTSKTSAVIKSALQDTAGDFDLFWRLHWSSERSCTFEARSSVLSSVRCLSIALICVSINLKIGKLSSIPMESSALPPEIIDDILSGIWSSSMPSPERIQFMTICSLLNSTWKAVFACIASRQIYILSTKFFEYLCSITHSQTSIIYGDLLPNSTRSMTCQPDLDSSTSNPATEMYMTLCKQRNFFGLHTCFPNVQKLNLRLSRQQTCYIKLVHGVKQVVHTEICFHMDSSSRLTTIRTTWSIVMGYDMGYLSNLPEDFDRERWHADNVDDWLRLMFPFTLIGIQTALTHYPSAGDTVGVVHDEDHTIHYHYERYDP
ncbi:hypothetical protein EV421DRAFT_1439515 [Armillaria borealis]|uniref:F-box domain-containing protein n=1 Tax=Armillaria borealis TaxID=47425 RepID=A0AA39IZI4_9AGAR|nr:hypothetical protein EV421DRAFT_1439515 [Armillaria borealis]